MLPATVSNGRIGVGRVRPPRVRHRRYCLTLNNPTVADCVRWTTLCVEGKDTCVAAKKMSFFVCQSERGTAIPPRSRGTFHYQGYVEFSAIVEFSTVKDIFGNRVHMEASRGNVAANIMYCTKVADRVTGEILCVSGQWGLPKSTGNAMLVALAARSGDTYEEIDDANPAFCMMNREKVQSYVASQKPTRSEKPKIVILFGPTGCGKSQWCARNLTDCYWVSAPSGKHLWFGNYWGQSTCLFDDFTDKWMTVNDLMSFFDSTPKDVFGKGTQVKFSSTDLVITCNVDPRDWYSGDTGRSEYKDALQRRIREFAKIYDCSATVLSCPLGSVVSMERILRVSEFSFRGSFDYPSPGNSGFGAF